MRDEHRVFSVSLQREGCNDLRWIEDGVLTLLDVADDAGPGRRGLEQWARAVVFSGHGQPSRSTHQEARGSVCATITINAELDIRTPRHHGVVHVSRVENIFAPQSHSSAWTSCFSIRSTSITKNCSPPAPRLRNPSHAHSRLLTTSAPSLRRAV